MTGWDRESIDIVNRLDLKIEDPGPLHVPIHRFKIRRDDKLAVVIETEGVPEFPPVLPPPSDGLPRLRTEEVRMRSQYGATAVLRGVVSTSLAERHHEPRERKEVADIHRLYVSTGHSARAAYIIEWLENLPFRPFHWPDSIAVATNTTTKWDLSGGSLGLSAEDERGGFSQAAAKLSIAGATLYVCSLDWQELKVGRRPGCIIYVGTPDEAFRKRVRTALSFALGLYLIELGHTVYDESWDIISFISMNAYSLDQRAFELDVRQMTSLSKRGIHWDLDRESLAQMVNALVTWHDRLDLGNLSWAYWHARCSTVHAAPAQFGAAIEALQRSYIKSAGKAIRRKILADKEWEKLKDAVTPLLDAVPGLTVEQSGWLKNSFHDINRVPQRPLLRSVMSALGLELSDDEDAAWKRRNDSAHGMPVREGEELAAIRDMHLLRGVFHRMLLAVTKAANVYFDYTSSRTPVRPLREGAKASTEGGERS